MLTYARTYHFKGGARYFAVFLAIVAFHCGAFAQADPVVDTVPVLKYEIDTTYQPPIREEEYNADEDSVNLVLDPPHEVKPEYFLRKEFTGGFTDTLRLKRVSDSALAGFMNDEAFWYANGLFKKKQPKQKKAFGGSPFFQTLLWLVIIGGFATFLVIYLHNSNAGLFRRSKTIRSIEEDAAETGNIFAINYNREIERAVQNSDYRLAVRLMYLRVLKELADRNMIQYKQDNTNFDYLLQLHPTPVYSDFHRLTRSYEYSWYGQFEIDREKFSTIKKDFEHFDKKLY